MTLSQDYRLVREAAAVGTLAERRQIAVTGADRGSYLQGLLTNDVAALQAGRGCYALWLTPQGRMLTDLHVLESGTMMLLDVPEAAVEPTRERLEQFIFTEDVQVASLAGQLAAVWVHGPQAAATLARVLEGAGELPSWQEYRHAPLMFNGNPASVARIDQVGVPGFCVFVDPPAVIALNAALAGAGAPPVAAAALEAARIEAAYPLFGIDLDEDIIPLEAGIEGRAISFSKGCYVGQEVVIRVLHRGHGRVAKRLVSLRFDGEPPAPRSRLLAGDRDVGFVTSSAVSPEFGPIGLGYVHRDFVAPGTALAGATVIQRPVG